MSGTVTPAEANLLWLARAAVEEAPAPRLARLVELRVDPPPRLGPTARQVLAQTLGQGLVLALARHGGWRAEPGGRLWERRPPPPLRFTASVVQVLQWMLANPLADAVQGPLTLARPLEPAEEAFLVLLASRPDAARWRAALCGQAALRRAPLFVLAFAAEVARVRPLEGVPPFDLAALGTLAEGLVDLLAGQWASATAALSAAASAAEARQVGEAQAAVLAGWLSACDAAGRRDLADFVVGAAARLVRGPPWAPPAFPQASVREGAQARRAAVALFRAVERVRGWDQQHRAVHFIDDGYAMAQALVRRWERLGEAGFATAARLVAAADGLG